MAVQYCNYDIKGTLAVTGTSTLTGAVTIAAATSGLLSIQNTTNGGGAAIRFMDTTAGTQPGDLTYRHSDSQSQGGGASWHFVAEDQTHIVVGDGSKVGRVVVKSGGNVAKADYAFFDDINTGLLRTSADNVSLVAGGVAGIGVGSTAVSLKHSGSTKLATTSAGITVTGGGTFSSSVTASGNSNSFGNTTIAALSATSGTFSSSVTASGNSNSFGTTTFSGLVSGITPTATANFTTKAYVDSAVSGVSSGVTSVATTNGITGGTITSTGTIQVDSTVVRTTGAQTIANLKTFTERADFTNAAGIRTNQVRTYGGQQLVLNAGESSSYATGQTAEIVYINAEAGLEINSSPDNWSSGWAGRNYAYINRADATSSLPGLLTIATGITITGTGRIQGIDTVSASTDAANKAYVDAHVSPAGTYLPLAGGTMTGDVRFNDGVEIEVGTSRDLVINHDGSNSYIKQIGTGDLYIRQSTDDKDIIFQSDNGSGGVATYFFLDGSQTNVNFQKDAIFGDSKKALFGGSGDLQIYHDSSNSYITDNGTGVLAIQTNGSEIQVNSTGGEYLARFIPDSTVKLYYDNVQKFQTTSTGIEITGKATSTATVGSDGSSTLTTKSYVDAQIATIPSGLNFQGNWNASTNSPTLASGTGTPGFYYNVSVAGSTNLDGETDWQVGDWAVFVEAGATDKWEKIDNTSALTGTGVAGRVAYWDSTNNLTQDSDLTFNGSSLVVGGTVTAQTGNSVQWAEAYNNQITAISDSGSSTITLTLTQEDGGTLTTSFSNPQGTVTKSGTPVNNQLAVWTSATNVEGEPELTYDGSTFTVGGSGNTTTYLDVIGTNTAGAPARAAAVRIYGYEGRGEGIFYYDTAYANDEWYSGIPYSGGSSYQIGFDTSGGQAEYVANSVLRIASTGQVTFNKYGQSTFSGTVTTYPAFKGDGQIVDRTPAQVLSDIGGAPATGGSYLPLAGGTMTGDLKLNDTVQLKLGTSNDLRIYHSGTNSNIENNTGTLQIIQNLDDGDIEFKSDNGSGSTATYMSLDGSATRVNFFQPTRHSDGVVANFGGGNDLQLYHNGSTSSIYNNTGNLVITNAANDSDIIFKSDDGSGGTAEYFRIDGGDEINYFFKDIKLLDNGKIKFGDGSDLQIYHDSSNSYIDNATGSLLIRNTNDNYHVIIQSDNGGGGVADYFRAKGDTGEAILYHYGNQKFATTSTGVSVTGGVTANGAVSSFGAGGTGDGDAVVSIDGGSGTNGEAYLRLTRGGTSGFILNHAASSLQVRATANIPMYFYTNDTVALTLNTSQNATFAGDLTVSGGDISLGGTGRIQGVDTVSAGTDAASKDYVDTAVAGSGSGTVTSVSSSTTSQLTVSQSSPAPALSIVTAAVTNGGTALATGDQIYDATTTRLGSYLPLAGSVYDGNTGSWSNGITGNLALVSTSGTKGIFIGDDDNGAGQLSAQFNSNNGGGTLANNGGNLEIIAQNYGDGSDIIFKGNDTSNNLITYFQTVGASQKVRFIDNIKLTIGNGDDLQIYHDGSNSYINEAGTGSLVLKTGALLVRNPSDASMLDAQSGAAINLYYNGTKKFETTSAGVATPGSITVGSTGSAPLLFTKSTYGDFSTDAFYRIKFQDQGGVTNDVGIGQTATGNLGFNITAGKDFLFNGGTTGNALTLTSGGNATFAGDITLGASSSIVLDDTPTASTASGSGTIVNWSVSETVVAGSLYAVKTNGGWTLADADNENTAAYMLGIALGTNATQGMLLQGFFYKSGHGFTIGAPLYVSTTGGTFSNSRPTASNDYVRVIGYATSTNYIYFDPDKTWVKID